MSLIISKTRKEHECAYCGKTILRGTEAKVLVEEGFGSVLCGGEFPVGYKMTHRTYWHQECPTIIRRMKSLHEMTDEEFTRYMKAETEEELQEFMVERIVEAEN